MNWQQYLNEGDYHGALQSQGYHSFTPGDGSWSDFLFRLMHHREQPAMPEDVFLNKVADCSLTCEEYDVYWKCYVSICRYYQQPVKPCVFYADFVKQTPQKYALAMAQRGDVEGLDIVCHHFGLLPSWEFIDLLPCTLEPRYYLHLIPWNDGDIEERLITHMQRRFQLTGQVSQALYMIDKAFQYLSSNGNFQRLQQLKEEYENLVNSEVVKTEQQQQEHGNFSESSVLPNTQTATFPRKRHRRFYRHFLHLEEYCKMWQQAACHAQQEAETLGRECNALQERIAFLEASVSKVNTVADTLDLFIKECKKSSTCGDSVLDFLQGLHGCLQSLGDDSEFVSNEIVATKQTMQIERLKAKAEKVQSQMVKSPEAKEMPCEDTSENVNQVSFSSMDESTESPNDDDVEIQQLQQTVRSLEKQLEQQQYEHDMESN